MRTMSYVDRIVQAFGGVRPMARRLGRQPSTVAAWLARGSIPDRNKPAILEAAHADGLGLGPADFLPGAASGADPSAGRRRGAV